MGNTVESPRRATVPAATLIGTVVGYHVAPAFPAPSSSDPLAVMGAQT